MERFVLKNATFGSFFPYLVCSSGFLVFSSSTHNWPGWVIALESGQSAEKLKGQESGRFASEVSRSSLFVIENSENFLI